MKSAKTWKPARTLRPGRTPTPRSALKSGAKATNARSVKRFPNSNRLGAGGGGPPGGPPPQEINIKITAGTVGKETVYNFSYDPGTVHVPQGQPLDFKVTGVPLTKAWVVFDVPAAMTPFYYQLVPKSRYVASMDERGAHHYQFIGVHANGDLVADVYCPSVIVH
jgi:hypothetical protein